MSCGYFPLILLFSIVTDGSFIYVVFVIYIIDYKKNLLILAGLLYVSSMILAIV